MIKTFHSLSPAIPITNHPPSLRAEGGIVAAPAFRGATWIVSRACSHRVRLVAFRKTAGPEAVLFAIAGVLTAIIVRRHLAKRR